MLQKKSKSNGIANLLSIANLIAFSWVIIVSALPSAFLHLHVPLNHWLTIYLGVASLHVLFRSGKDPCKCRKYLSC